MNEGMIMADHFYLIDKKLKACHKLNEGASSEVFDTSDDVQDQVLTILQDDITKIKSICSKYSKPIPTEIKIIYDTKLHKMNTEYKYDKQFKKNTGLTDIVDTWFEEEKRKNE